MYSVTAKEIMEEFNLRNTLNNKKLDEVHITTSDINRSGLQLTGFLDYFASDRIQILGKAEMAYLENLSNKDLVKKLDIFFSQQFPLIIITRGQELLPEIKEASQKYKIPVLRTNEITSCFMAALIRYLNLQLAPRITKHAGLVEVFGEGILMMGDSGVGKSETALELVKRGHRLIADDVVEIRKVSDKTLIGTAPDIIRHLIEIRGIGILDVKNLYGIGSVKVIDNIDLVIQLELWDRNKDYDRLGFDDTYMEILGISVPSLTIPVRPGRNLAIVAEVAALNNRQKKMGYNAAKDLNERIISGMEKKEE
jgi:HPr kinase/phosphorylase